MVALRKSVVKNYLTTLNKHRLEYFKRELIKVLDEQERNEPPEVSKAFLIDEMLKSMTDLLCIAKGGKVGIVGEIRTWNGKKYKKMPNKKWVRVYDTHDKHTEISIARLKGKVRKAQSVDELFEIVMNNTHRFSDENGKPLDIVLELKKEVDAKKKALNAGKPSTKEQIKKEQKKKNQKVELTEKQKENLEKINDILNKNVETFPVGEFSEENFEKLFANGIDSPIEHIKIGENQYQKLIEKNRQDLIAAMADVMKNPALIMKTDTGAKVYAKTYERKNHKKTVISVIVDKGKLHISISTHIEKNKQLAKKMDSILFDRTESVHGDNASQEKTPDNSNIAQDNNDVNKKIKIKEGLTKTSVIAAYMAKKLETFGYEIENKQSGLSNSEYIIIKNSGNLFGKEDTDDVEIRIADHDLPPTYDKQYQTDFDVRSNNNNRGGTNGNAKDYEDVLAILAKKKGFATPDYDKKIEEQNRKRLEQQKEYIAMANEVKAKVADREWALDYAKNNLKDVYDKVMSLYKKADTVTGDKRKQLRKKANAILNEIADGVNETVKKSFSSRMNEILKSFYNQYGVVNDQS